VATTRALKLSHDVRETVGLAAAPVAEAAPPVVPHPVQHPKKDSGRDRPHHPPVHEDDEPAKL
jgi:hypothetical protein